MIEKCCETCANLIAIGEGDHICDARPDALISCIDAYEDRANLSRNNCRPIPIFDLSTVKAIIGMVDE